MFTKTIIQEVVRYGLVAVAGYGTLLGGSYLLVEHAELSPSLAYLITLSLVYIGVYVSLTRFVFAVEFNRKRLIRFAVVLGGIWILNNAFFNLLNLVYNVHYLLAA